MFVSKATVQLIATECPIGREMKWWMALESRERLPETTQVQRQWLVGLAHAGMHTQN